MKYFFKIVLFFLLISACTGESIDYVNSQKNNAKSGKKKYYTISHQVLEREAEISEKEPDFTYLDRIIDDAKSQIKTKVKYTPDDAPIILRQIYDIILRNRVIFKDTVLFGDTFVPRIPDKQAVRKNIGRLGQYYFPDGWKSEGIEGNIQKFFNLVNKKKEKFYYADNYSYSLIYLAIAEELNLPVKLCLIPDELMIRWYVFHKSHFNYSPEYDYIINDKKKDTNNQISRISKWTGVYLKDLDNNAIMSYALGRRGLYYAKKGDLKNAEKDFEQSLKKNPKNVQTYLIRGEIYFNRNDLEKAKKNYLKVINLNKNSITAMVALGKIYIKLDEKSQASSYFDRAVKVSIRKFDTHLLIGDIWFQNKEYIKAISHFSNAINVSDKMNPNLFYAYTRRARSYRFHGERDKALKDLNHAEKLKPDHPFIFSERGDIWLEKKSYDNALFNYNKSIERDPASAYLYNQRGYVHLKLGNMEKSEQDFSKAISLNPKDDIQYIRRAALYKKTGDIHRAIKDAEKAMELNPESTFHLDFLAEIYIASEDVEFRNPQKGLELAKKSVDIKRNHYELYTLSEAYSENKNIPKAIEILNEAISLLKDEESIKKYKQLLEFYKSGKTYNEYLESNKKREKVEE
jgi:tetratricopeptide (TPR) repeat protein